MQHCNVRLKAPQCFHGGTAVSSRGYCSVSLKVLEFHPNEISDTGGPYSPRNLPLRTAEAVHSKTLYRKKLVAIADIRNSGEDA